MKDNENFGKQTLVVLYGSQTGTAENVAERVGREGYENGFNPLIYPMNDYEFENLSMLSLVCFIASTTGQGEEPDNMKLFWNKLLKRSISNDFLSYMKFTVLGLGDSSYTQYNFVAKKLYKRLLQLGGTPLTELFLADDQNDLGPEVVIDEWLVKLWSSLVPSNVPLINNNNSGKLVKSKFSITKDVVKTFEEDTVAEKNICKCELIRNERVTTSDHFQDVRLIGIDLSESNLDYKPGDVLMIQPSNSQANVKQFFKLFPNLSTEKSETFNLSPNWPWSSIPKVFRELNPAPWTWHQIVENYFDLQAIPKRYFFQLLEHFTNNELEREKLLQFCSVEGQQDLFTYCNRPKRSVIEVLEDFPDATSNIPSDFLFDLIQPIKPRAFSIASSMAALNNELQILVAVVNYQTRLKKPRLGLCSNWLSNLPLGFLIPVWIERGSFNFPSCNQNNAVIMISPGTGCAPFRSFISERAGGHNDLTLIFGCRFKEKDFYFEDEWISLQNDGKLRLITAFSRQNPNASRIYVQHKIEEYGRLLWDLIENQKGIIFVAGNAKQMPLDVSEAFLSIFRQYGCPNPETYMKNLVKSHRYQTEVWS